MERSIEARSSRGWPCGCLAEICRQALLSSLLLVDWMGYFSVVILKAYCFLYQLMLPKLNGNGRSIILFSNLVVATFIMKSYELHTWMFHAEVMIGSIGEEAAKIRAALPPGHGHVVFDTSLLPSTFRTLLRALGNQCKIYIHTDSPPTAEWGFQSRENSRQEPRWVYLILLIDVCFLHKWKA